MKKMNLTKDEARILAALMEEGKYELVPLTSEPVLKKLNALQLRLEEYGKDNRRNGRKTLNNFSDCLTRFATKK